MVKKVIEGNIILRSEELRELREAVIERYAALSGKPISNLESVFNSNLKNYEELKKSLKKQVESDLKSNKPLAVLFHFSKSNPEGMVTFRKKFIDSLYKYAHKISREEFLEKSKSAFVSSIEGYWECYYDKFGHFAEHLRSGREASISKLAFWIDGDGIHNSTAQFFQSNNKGKGSVEARGANLIFQLENEIKTEPHFMIMNCGRDIEDSTVHFKRMVGCFLYIDDAGSPKVGKCIMFYITNIKKKWNLDNSDAREKFSKDDSLKFQLDNEETEPVLKKVKEYFFEEDTNTITANVNVFKAIINKPKLEKIQNAS
jgi:hypothetical protein